jgi:hypothetical protein
MLTPAARPLRLLPLDASPSTTLLTKVMTAALAPSLTNPPLGFASSAGTGMSGHSCNEDSRSWLAVEERRTGVRVLRDCDLILFGAFDERDNSTRDRVTFELAIDDFSSATSVRL